MKILVAHKKSRYEQLVLEEHDQSVERLIAQHDQSVAHLESSHRAHMESLEHVAEVIRARGLELCVAPRGEVQGEEDDYDLVITVGGDGTLLDVSHRLSATPVLGINSDPATSVGYFCAGPAERFADLLDKALQSELDETPLRRFRVTINGEPTTPPVLNEILICHANPAAVSSYLLGVDDHQESQRSSGVWVATPAGSTAAIRSAGGLVMPLGSDALQFLVREPYLTRKRRSRLLKGLLPPGSRLEIVSKMQQGRLYVDGPHIAHPFQIGDRLTLEDDVAPLRVLGLEATRRVG